MSVFRGISASQYNFLLTEPIFTVFTWKSHAGKVN